MYNFMYNGEYCNIIQNMLYVAVVSVSVTCKYCIDRWFSACYVLEDISFFTMNLIRITLFHFPAFYHKTYCISSTNIYFTF